MADKLFLWIARLSLIVSIPIFIGGIAGWSLNDWLIIPTDGFSLLYMIGTPIILGLGVYVLFFASKKWD